MLHVEGPVNCKTLGKKTHQPEESELVTHLQPNVG